MLSVVLTTNSNDEPVILVEFSKFGRNVDKPLRFTAYSVSAMLGRLRASRTRIKSYLGVEQVCYPAGETDTMDDVIEYLLLLDFMIHNSGTPFDKSFFMTRWGKLPFTADHTTKFLVKEFLSC